MANPTYNFSAAKGAAFFLNATRTALAAGQHLNLIIQNPFGSGKYVVIHQFLASMGFDARPHTSGGPQFTAWGYPIGVPSSPFPPPPPGLPTTDGWTPVATSPRLITLPPPTSVALGWKTVGARIQGPHSPNDASVALAAHTPQVVDVGIALAPGITFGVALQAPTSLVADAAITMAFDEYATLPGFVSDKRSEPTDMSTTGVQVDALFTLGGQPARLPIVCWLRHADGEFRGVVVTAGGMIQDAATLPGFTGYAAPGTPGVVDA